MTPPTWPVAPTTPIFIRRTYQAGHDGRRPFPRRSRSGTARAQPYWAAPRGADLSGRQPASRISAGPLGQVDQSGRGPEVLVATEVAHGLDVEGLGEQLRVARAHARERVHRRVHELGKALLLVRLVQDLAEVRVDRHGPSFG